MNRACESEGRLVETRLGALTSSAAILLLAVLAGCRSPADRPSSPAMRRSADSERVAMTIEPSADFVLDGSGTQPEWRAAQWVSLNRRQGGDLPYEAKLKALYSETGLYFLFEATDRKLTATFTEDFSNLWTEDVFEIFLWTDERYPVYFEYEISPLGVELPILIPNFGGEFLGWRPWHYDGERKTRTATQAIGGAKESGAAVDGWRAEVFIPYVLLRPLQNVPPTAGSEWRANFYRVDHDDGRRTTWDWSRVGSDFHEFEAFGRFRFE